MKTNAIVRIIIWSFVLILLLGILGSFLFIRYVADPFVISNSAVKSQVTIPLDPAEGASTAPVQSFPSSDISRLEIEWVAGDITILAKDGIDQISVQEEAVSDSRYIMEWRQSGSTLKIKFFEETQLRIGTSVDISKDLVIEVPADWICEELELDVAAANLELHDLTIHKVDFDGASGTCDIVNCNVNDLDMDAASGDVTFRGSLSTLDFDAASASFIGEFQNTPSWIDMDGMSGNLDIALPEDTGYTISVEGMSSTLRSDFQGTEIHNGSHVYGDGRCRIQVDGMSCDVTIRKLDAVSK